ncbi:MAG TPA: ABC transporter permease [Actinomycetes bacterium]|nr:ABC transporter permease [Actinomycetes bacterium]
MSSTLRLTPPLLQGIGRAPSVVERNVVVYQRGWLMFASGVLEPLFYLLSLGLGLGHLISSVTLGTGQTVTYQEFVAPAMLAASAMQGAVLDVTYNVFFRFKYAKLYDAMLATPLSTSSVAVGEVAWAVMRGAAYSAMFLLVMLALGLVLSWWAVLVLPAAVLAGFAFAGAGMAATTYMRSWQDFSWVSLVTLPLFLLSATFFPLATYPTWVQPIVRCSPLYPAVDLIRSFTLGHPHPGLVVDVVYLLVLGVAGTLLATKRLDRLLLT